MLALLSQSVLGVTPPCPTLPTSSDCPPLSPAHTDSEGRSCASAGGHPLSTARDLATTPLSPEPLFPELLSSELPSLDPSHCDLLGSRLERE